MLFLVYKDKDKLSIPIQIKVIDNMGRELWHVDDYQLSTIDMTSVPNGIYVIQMKIGEEPLKSQKVIIIK